MEENNNFETNQYEEKSAISQVDKVKVLTNALSISLAAVIIIVVIWALATVMAPGLNPTGYTSKYYTQEQLERLEKAAELLDDNYLYDYDMDKLIDSAIGGMVEGLDNQFSYYENEEAYQESLNTGDKETYVGIGVHLTLDADTNTIRVISPMPGSPALDAGLLPGDLILKVGDKTVVKGNYLECVDDIKGEKGTSVHLVVYRNGEQLEFDIERTEIRGNNVTTDIIDGIGYIRVFAFENGVYKQFKAAYEEVTSQNIKGLIVDLRNNPGGLVNDTVNMLDLIVPKGTKILRLVDKKGDDVYSFTTRENTELELPLVVLVNQNSASASEIFSSVVRDTNKGTIIGTKTFGKGVVQYVMPIKGHGALTIVSAQYFTPSNVVIQENGIEPDIEVQLSDDIKNNIYVDKDKDLQLQKAIEVINEKL